MSKKLAVPKSKQKKFYDVRYSSARRASHKLSSLPSRFYDERLIELMLEVSKKEKGQTVLDVGTGQGTDALLLSKKVDQVVGIDISPEALRIAKIMVQTKDNSGNISLVVGDAEHLPFKGGLFDVVYCKDALHHVSNSMQTVLEMKRVAKDKGSVAAIEANALNPQMIVIGLIYFFVDKGVFKSTRRRLQTLFLNAELSSINAIATEFLPRHMLFEYRSPFNKVLVFNNSLILEILKKIEAGWQKRAFLREFSNYLLIVGFKNK